MIQTNRRAGIGLLGWDFAMETSSIAEFLEESFDILSVGGGTAGSVLASRLSENPEIRVGLIEAGHSRLGDPNIELPTAVGKMLHNPAYDWAFRSIPQIGTGGRVYHIPRGRMLGGSSGINFMYYGRPSEEDITQWSEALGITGWSWPELLSYFKRTERLELDQPNIRDRNVDECPLNTKYHGLSGAIHTSFSTWSLPLEKDLLRAFDEVSRQPRTPTMEDILAFIARFSPPTEQKKPIRSYALNGYLAPVSGRRNLKVLTGAVVCKILLKWPQNGEHGVDRSPPSACD
ncbi:hypothetical protein UA08_05024 [Talaromyces atroroseus]|uniref:Glucose-methanol-choline oxidoreductase N-terminal domain-containing protein n=1 Tax=Talaromyces atroroseus TaxID=1441469 RepID=A0A225AEJ3_TALAT|nr:hypothetical protein UA08_05024 [Talaromyces atroroseus]OKL59692.1 hypothetical protein UA08_05024 [Talaromyces atroroseus]